MKKILIVFVLMILVACSFVVGIYMKLIDVQELAEQWKLNEYPVIGQFFSAPKTNFEPVELAPQSSQVTPIGGPLNMTQREANMPPQKKVDDAELQKLAKAKQQEELKRISKLARLYGNMKADEAAAILNQMDDSTVLIILSKMEDEQVAKIMSIFDSKRAAALSQSMLRGTNVN